MQHDFCTIVVVAEEGAKQLEFFLQHYRKCYPKAPLHIISDGVANLDYPKLCKKYHADYTLSRYYKRIECGGLWWKRTLEIGLKYNKKWILKADPDTKFWRPFTVEPECSVAGTLTNKGEARENVQGGCQAIRRDIARKILDSGILQSEDLIQSRFCPDSSLLTNWIPTGYFTTDYSFMYIMKKLGIKYGDWKEVGSTWRVAPANYHGRYAVTHPHKIDEHHHTGVPDSTPITIITTCKGRLHHLKRTLPKWLAEKNVNVVVVDYNCPQKTAAWLEEHYPNVRVARVHNENRFHLSRARNIGANYAQDGWWAFLDADMLIEPGWADSVRKSLKTGYYFIANPMRWGMCGSVVIHSNDFRKVGGYDEIIRGWASEDMDLYARCRQINVRPGYWDGDLAETIKHDDDERTKFYDSNKALSASIGKIYCFSKNKLMVEKWALPTLKDRETLWAEASAEAKLHCSNPYNGHSVEQTTTNKLVSTGIELSCKNGASSTGVEHRGQGTWVQTSTQPTQAQTTGHQTAISPPKPKKVPPMNISVVNHSSIHLGISLEELCKVGMDYAGLLNQYWPGTAVNLIPTEVILPNTYAIVIMDDPDQNQQSLGYHNLTPDGFPLAKVFAKAEMVQGVPLTITFTHELAEFLVDPNNSRSAVGVDGVVHAVEVCDPVDDDSFQFNGYPVANFVLPSWYESFRKPSSTKFDYMGLLSQPFSMTSGGYTTVRSQVGQWMQIYGSHPKSEALGGQDQRGWRGDVRNDQHHASTRLAHNNYHGRR